MSLHHFDYLIVGGGVAAGAAAAELASASGGRARGVAILGAEPVSPYHRPPLSKGFLLDGETEESLFVNPDSFYQENGIELILGTRALGLDASGHRLETAAGVFTYGRLLVTTGSRPRKLEVTGGDLKGIFYLRTLADAKAIKEAAAPAEAVEDSTRRAVVVGGGFIGLEVASALAQKGLKTTLVHRGRSLLEPFGLPDLGQFLANYFREQGVELLLGDEVGAFEGASQVEAVVTRWGRRLPCPLVVVGVGVTPEVGFLTGSGLALENGIVVDEYLRTSAPDVYAAGDVANFFDPLYGRHRRIEHWDNALYQGRLAARNLMGAGEAYDHVSYFFSDLFDLAYDFLGDPPRAGQAEEIIRRGSLAEGSFIALYLQDNRLQAAFVMDPKARRPLEELIGRKADLSSVRDKLLDPRFPLSELVS